LPGRLDPDWLSRPGGDYGQSAAISRNSAPALSSLAKVSAASFKTAFARLCRRWDSRVAYASRSASIAQKPDGFGRLQNEQALLHARAITEWIRAALASRR
jgi:hypothetical protein